MRRKSSVFKIASALFAMAIALTVLNPVSVFAKEENFTYNGYRYQGTGYTTTAWTNNTELVAKIDTYLYDNPQEERFAGEDVYFYKRDSAGNRLSASVYGYAYTEFKRDGKVLTKSDVVYGYDNVEVMPDEGVSGWAFATPHYYAGATNEK